MSIKKANVTRSSSLFTLSTAVLLATLSSGSALAGFEWTPPQVEQPVRPMIVKSQPMDELKVVKPVAEEKKEKKIEAIQKPEIQWYQPEEVKAETKVERAEIKSIAKSTVEKAPTKLKTLSITEDKHTAKPAPQKTVKQVITEAVESMDEKPAPTQSIISAYKLAQGFGKDVPLALALRQIVPADFGYAVQNNANLGLRVDWSGNKPWNEVLNAAIQKYDLEAVVLDKTVLIKKLGAPIEPPKAKQVLQKTDDQVIEIKSDMMQEDEAISQKAASKSKKPTSLITASQWRAQEGDELYPVMVQWCNAAGVKLLWHAKEKYEISEDIDVNGNFEDAVQKILMTFKGQDKRPVGMFKANDPKAKAVLSVNDASSS